ncbi:hypothetical protein HYX16_00380 [Candidatus Woesearchaeota archaeon]|nr:hypothetical protein [Candidatus Woesearchaeota archaeon]
MINKRGIAPLIAAVLLIGFTVVLAAITFTWGNKLTEGLFQTSEERSEKDIACFSDFSLKFRKAEIIEDNKIRLLVENNGQGNINKFKVKIYGENGVDNIETSDSINSYEIKNIEIPYDSLKTGNVNEVEMLLSSIQSSACVICSNVK